MLCVFCVFSLMLQVWLVDLLYVGWDIKPCLFSLVTQHVDIIVLPLKLGMRILLRPCFDAVVCMTSTAYSP